MQRTKHQIRRITMAERNVYFKCGCVETITGSERDARLRSAEIENEICADCRHQMEAKHAKATEQARAANQDLPALTGSEKQIAWAETIRARQCARLREIKEMILRSPRGQSEVSLLLIGRLDSLIQRTVAKDWIDTRGQTYNQVWIMDERSALRAIHAAK